MMNVIYYDGKTTNINYFSERTAPFELIGLDIIYLFYIVISLCYIN